MEDVLAALGRIGVLPVVEVEHASDAVPLAEALAAGGIRCAEITLRTPVAMTAIRGIAREVPDFIVGAGTVLASEQVEEAVDAGARFLVSPGFDETLMEHCPSAGVPMMPGVATPTEIMAARRCGLRIVKYFPAELLGGARMIQTLGGPFPDMRFVPTGGITAATLAEYLRLPAIHACGGSWMATRPMIAEGQFDEIRRLAAEARRIVQSVRGRGDER